MRVIPVFAGLGSDVLFSDATREQAINDASTPESRVLLDACHSILLEEIALSIESEESGINTKHFAEPRQLLTPLRQYHDNPIVQHATLCITQLLRYQQDLSAARGQHSHTPVAVVGFCKGLLAAIAVAASQNTLDYLVKATQCFRAAVIIGIASERLRMKLQPVRTSHPWSVIVANINSDEVSASINDFNASVVRENANIALRSLLTSHSLLMHLSS